MTILTHWARQMSIRDIFCSLVQFQNFKSKVIHDKKLVTLVSTSLQKDTYILISSELVYELQFVNLQFC